MIFNLKLKSLRILEEWKEGYSEWVRLEDESIRNIHEFLNRLHINNKVLKQKFSLSHHRGLEDPESSAHNFASPLNINILQVNSVPDPITLTSTKAFLSMFIFQPRRVLWETFPTRISMSRVFWNSDRDFQCAIVLIVPILLVSVVISIPLGRRATFSTGAPSKISSISFSTFGLRRT